MCTGLVLQYTAELISPGVYSRGATWSLVFYRLHQFLSWITYHQHVPDVSFLSSAYSMTRNRSVMIVYKSTAYYSAPTCCSGVLNSAQKPQEYVRSSKFRSNVCAFSLVPFPCGVTATFTAHRDNKKTNTVRADESKGIPLLENYSQISDVRAGRSSIVPNSNHLFSRTIPLPIPI